MAPKIRDAIKGSGLRMLKFQIENLTVPLETGIRPVSSRTQTVQRLPSPGTRAQSVAATADTQAAYDASTDEI